MPHVGTRPAAVTLEQFDAIVVRMGGERRRNRGNGAEAFGEAHLSRGRERLIAHEQDAMLGKCGAQGGGVVAQRRGVRTVDALDERTNRARSLCKT